MMKFTKIDFADKKVLPIFKKLRKRGVPLHRKYFKHEFQNGSICPLELLLY